MPSKRREHHHGTHIHYEDHPKTTVTGMGEARDVRRDIIPYKRDGINQVVCVGMGHTLMTKVVALQYVRGTLEGTTTTTTSIRSAYHRYPINSSF